MLWKKILKIILTLWYFVHSSVFGHVRRETHTDLPNTTDVHITSINFNYSLSWKYDYPSLSSQVFFKVEYYNNLFEIWDPAEDCATVHGFHCDLFWNNFIQNDSSCPDDITVVLVKARVQPCLLFHPDACGGPVSSSFFNVMDQDNGSQSSSLSIELVSLRLEVRVLNPEKLFFESDKTLLGIITPPDFRILPRVVNNHLKIENKPHHVNLSHKSLNCYFDEDLKYVIQYYNEDVQNKIVQEKIDVSFEMESIALPLNRTLRSQTKMCVKMKITNDGETVSQWKEQCVLVITESDSKLVFWLPLAGCVFSVLLFLLFLGCKIRRYYKSLDFEIPEELKEIKMEMESKEFGFYLGQMMNQPLCSRNEKFKSIDAADPLTLQDKQIAKFPLLAEIKVQLKSNCSIADNSSEVLPLYPPATASYEDSFDVNSNQAQNDNCSSSYVLQVESGEFVSANQSQHLPTMMKSPLSLRNQNDDFPENGSNVISQDNFSPILVPKVYSDKCNTLKDDTAVPRRSNLSDVFQHKMIQSAVPSKSFENRYDSVFTTCQQENKYRSTADKRTLRRHGIIKLANPTYALLPCNELTSSENLTCNCPGLFDGHFATCKLFNFELSECTNSQTSRYSDLQCESKQSFLCKTEDPDEKFQKSVGFLKSPSNKLTNSKVQKFSSSVKDSKARKSSSTIPKIPRKAKEKTYASSVKSPIPLILDPLNSVKSYMHSNRQSYELSEDSVPPYVIYSRSRHDSHRSADSGFLQSFSDDSASPPQSPDESCIAKSLGLSQYRNSFNRSSFQDERSHLRVSKELNSHVRFKYDPRLSLSEITEDLNVQSTPLKETISEGNHLSQVESDRDDLSYVQISSLSQQTAL